MSKPKLTYFDFSGSRGEECRIALRLAGIDFEDNRIDRETWMKLKPDSPFGSMPFLEIPGKGRVAESNAILTLIGRKHDLHPTDAWEGAQHEQLLSAAEHLRIRIAHTIRGDFKDDDAKKQARQDLGNGAIKNWGKYTEAALASLNPGTGPFVAGDKVNVADVKLYMVVNWIVSGIIDDMPTDVFNDCPKLLALYEGVKTHPVVAG